MKSRIVQSALLVAIVATSAFLMQCSVVKQVQQSMVNLQRCKFKLQNVANVKVAGIALAGKKSLSDFNLLDGAKLVSAFSSKSLPAELTLNVAASNPNDGTGGYPQTTATLVGFPWTLLIDSKPTINGDIGGRPEIPGTGKSTIIPLNTSLDLYSFFGDKGYEGVMNLALALGGVNGSAARLTLRGTPRISTPLGDISYPQPIEVIDREFRN